jgi:hypothetical protein
MKKVINQEYYYILLDLKIYNDLEWDLRSCEADIRETINKSGDFLLKRRRINKDNTETFDYMYRLQRKDVPHLRDVVGRGLIFDYTGNETVLHSSNGSSLSWDEYKLLNNKSAAKFNAF